MDDEELEAYLKAGRVAAKILKDAERVVKEGTRLIDICEILEGQILEAGCKPAFPCNICINEIAAHYTPAPLEDAIVPPNSLVKVDIGVHVNGFIADTARTIVLNDGLRSLVSAAEDALREAVKIVGPGVPVSDVGSAVEKVLKNWGFKPVWNLVGHQIARYSLHMGTSVPNVGGSDGGRFEVDGVYAIEPFVTLREAAGEVSSLQEARIYRCLRYRKERGVRAGARRGGDGIEALVSKIWENYRTLPFAERWLLGILEVPKDRLWSLWETVKASGFVKGYPILIERTRRTVAQAEHTVLVTQKGCQVLTEL
jgi:methionyl aminopeptidase